MDVSEEVLASRDEPSHDGVVYVFFAQSILEYTAVGSVSGLADTLRTAASSLMDGLKDIDQRTWMVIGGVLVVMMFLTRQSRRH